MIVDYYKQSKEIDESKRALFRKVRDTAQNVKNVSLEKQENSIYNPKISRRDFNKVAGAGFLSLLLPKLGFGRSLSIAEVKQKLEKAPPMIQELANRYDLADQNIDACLDFWRLFSENANMGRRKLDEGPLRSAQHALSISYRKDAPMVSDNFKKQEPIYPVLVELYNEFMDPTNGHEYIGVEDYAEKDSYIYYFGNAVDGLVAVTKPCDGLNTPNFGTRQQFSRIETNLYKSLFKVINPNNEVSRTEKFLSSSLDDKRNQIIEIRDLIKQGKNESGDVLSPIEKTYISYSVWGLNTLYGVITASRDKQQKEEAGNMFDLTYPYLEKELVRKLKILPEISGKPYLLNPNFWF